MWNEEIWNSRYRREGERTPGDTMRRVVDALSVDGAEYLKVLERGEFVPGGRVIANAAPGKCGMLLNCFNVPVEDSRHSVFTALADGSEVLAWGGGVGFNFSKLRPHGSPLMSTGGVSQGPIPFIDIFDRTFGLISKSYKRSAAVIAVLSSRHGDVYDFIHAKRNNGSGGDKRWSTMNISVDIDEHFDPDVFPNDKMLLQTIADSIWECGDPGLVFLHRAEKDNNVAEPITGVNPCGEVPLFDYGACCLGSINLSALVSGGKIDFLRLEQVSAIGVRFLNMVLAHSQFPGKAFKDVAEKYRRIGLGVTGLAHALIKCGIVYGSKESLTWIENVMGTIAACAYHESAELAREWEPFRGSPKKGFADRVVNVRDPLFNTGLLAVAPTGSTSMLLNTSPGVEPIFAVETTRTDRGVLRQIKDPLWGHYPEHLFKTSIEVTPDEHLAVMMSIQAYVDGAVSKTINMPESATKDDIFKILEKVTSPNCNLKGLTVYRDKSLGAQVVDLDQKIQNGSFYAVSTPSGTVHIPVGRDARGNIKQVYILLDKPGGEEFALASALGRVISIALQENTPVERIVKTLHSIGSGAVKWTTLRGKKTPILSAPDAVAKVLQDAINTGLGAAVLSVDICPDCNQPLIRAEGCVSCGCGSRCEIP